MTYCKNTKVAVHPNDPNDPIYDGYCFDCYSAGIPEMVYEINRLEDQLVSVACVSAVEEQQRGRKALDWLNGNYHWLIGSMTKEDQADLDAILGDWKPNDENNTTRN